MAAPNLVSPAAINSRTSVLVASTSPVAVVANSAASGKVYRIVSLTVANVDVSPYTITIDFYRGATATRMAKNVTVAGATTMVLLGRDAPIYLEEGDTLRATASAASKIEVICSYEVVS